MEDIINVLEHFAPVFSAKVWRHVKILLIGAILCRKERTVAAILRVMGLGNDPRFVNYHRVLSKARWSGLHAAKILLGLLVALVPVNLPIIIGVDETIERRKGKKIKDKGCYRDPVRSTEKHVIRCFGLKWLSMMLIVSVPWSERHWSLPFLTVLTPSKECALTNIDEMLVEFQLATVAAGVGNQSKPTPGELVSACLTSTASLETVVWEAEGKGAFLRNWRDLTGKVFQKRNV